MTNPLGTIQIAGWTLPVNVATFRYVEDEGIISPDTNDDDVVPGWDFNVYTGPPIQTAGPESNGDLFSNGVRFYTESDPIPLLNHEDLTGVELNLEDSFDPVSGEVYFTLYVGEHQDVSHLTLRFLERDGDRYRMTVDAMVHNVFSEPTPFQIDTWIVRLPAR